MIRILKYGEVPNSELFIRQDALDRVSDTVSEILENVRKNGDRAVLGYIEIFDHVRLESLKVSDEEMQEALSMVEPEFIEVLKRSAANIRNFHEKQLRTNFMINDRDGVMMGQKILPLERVGMYVPGGTAPLSSTVLMDTIPAKVAGVKEVIMVTSPGKDGRVNPYVLAAAHVAGVGRISDGSTPGWIRPASAQMVGVTRWPWSPVP